MMMTEESARYDVRPAAYDVRPQQALSAILARVAAAHRATMRCRTAYAQARETEQRALSLLKLAHPELYSREYGPAVLKQEPYLG